MLSLMMEREEEKFLKTLQHLELAVPEVSPTAGVFSYPCQYSPHPLWFTVVLVDLLPLMIEEKMENSLCKIVQNR